MDILSIIEELNANKMVLANLLKPTNAEIIHWKESPEKWSLLEVVCHLVDEEREDFRARIEHVLNNPDIEPPPIAPEQWVIDRKYASQDYEDKVEEFLAEREKSVFWLQSLQSPNWESSFNHTILGPMSAHLFLGNWLAHDLLHIRQITRIKFNFLNQSNIDLQYAGTW